MKKFTVLGILLLSAILLSGCGGQELDFTVYNCGVNVSAPGEWLHVIIDWEDGGSASFYPDYRVYSIDNIDSFNSYTFKVKENKKVRVQGGGFSIKVDGSGNTTLSSVDIGDTSQVVYGGLLESPHWYCAIYEDASYIYKK